MPMVTFTADGHERAGYLALPASGSGPGVLVLHAWWGLNDFFKLTCDRLAEQGFVALAPDLNGGQVATTIDEANHLMEVRDFPATRALAEAALRCLQTHPAVQGDTLGALGFSMGAAFSLLLDERHPGAFSRIVLFYGPSEVDLSASAARFQCHFGANDDWEPLENVKAMGAANAEVCIYADAGHWFIEEDRTGYYQADAAALAWQRTVAFLGATAD